MKGKGKRNLKVYPADGITSHRGTIPSDFKLGHYSLTVHWVRQTYLKKKTSFCNHIISRSVNIILRPLCRWCGIKQVRNCICAIENPDLELGRKEIEIWNQLGEVKTLYSWIWIGSISLNFDVFCPKQTKKDSYIFYL